MTSGLLKAHKYIWLVLLFVVPVFLFFSIKNLDYKQEKKEVISENEEVGKVVAQDDNSMLETTLFESDRGWVLEITTKQPLQSASTVLYPFVDGQRAKRSIGQIDTHGTHRFLVEERLEKLQLFDPIKNEIIIEIEL